MVRAGGRYYNERRILCGRVKIMNEWDVILVIGEVIALIVLVGGPIIKLNTTLTKLMVKLEELTASYKQSESSNTKAHARIWNKLDEHDEVLNDHETRLQLMEKK